MSSRFLPRCYRLLSDPPGLGPSQELDQRLPGLVRGLGVLFGHNNLYPRNRLDLGDSRIFFCYDAEGVPAIFGDVGGFDERRANSQH